MDQPLKMVVHIGDHAQQVIYEGIKQICFRCGTLGRKDLVCLVLPKTPASHSFVDIPPTSTSLPTSLSIDLRHNPWMVVQRRKPIFTFKKKPTHIPSFNFDQPVDLN